jgi:NADPH-dependent 2,4-dienoyl-CoA reductase/sulfur reductase-like enzyme
VQIRLLASEASKPLEWTLDDGIPVDRRLQAFNRDASAAGDACCFLHPGLGPHILLEKWKNAEDQAHVAVCACQGRRQSTIHFAVLAATI